VRSERSIREVQGVLYKVGTYGYTLETEDKIAEINDDDRETAHVVQALGVHGLRRQESDVPICHAEV